MTDEEYEKEIDKMYEEIDQKQAEMEELGLINYGDTSYYIQNPEEYEEDSKICELESEVMRLEYLLEISDKALELACEDKPRPIKYYGNYMCSVNDYIEFYKTKAKEKNEK